MQHAKRLGFLIQTAYQRTVPVPSQKKRTVPTYRTRRLPLQKRRTILLSKNRGVLYGTAILAFKAIIFLDSFYFHLLTFSVK